MKNLSLEEMESLSGGSTLQCLIDGVLTNVAVSVGFMAGGFFGAAGALLAGLYAANANGCFE